MSYGYLVFKVKPGVRTQHDLSPQTTETIGTGAEIQTQLSAIYPEIRWQPVSGHGAIFGSLDGADTWYEFRLTGAADICFSIDTSFRTDRRSLIPDICRKLGLVAFKQTCELIGL